MTDDITKVSKAYTDIILIIHTPSAQQNFFSKRPHTFSRFTQILCSDGAPVGPEFNPGRDRNTGMKCPLSSCSEWSFLVHVLLSLSGDLSMFDLDGKGGGGR